MGGKLTARRVASIKEEGRHSDGDGLYLNVAGGSRSWLFLWKRAGRRREMGLGPLRDVTLSEAREKAAAARRQLRDGLDPIAERRRPIGKTFGDAADAFLADNESSFRNAKHAAQWRRSVTDQCESIRDVPVAEVDVSHVLSVVQPMWTRTPETASRVRGRIERVLDYARAKGWRLGANPAVWRGHLSAILPKHDPSARGHHSALPFADVPSFMRRLEERPAIAALALRFAILTAARSGEVLGARWQEIDREAAVWTVPASRMKAKKEHRVPLSAPALAILATVAEQDGKYVFPGTQPGSPLSSMSMTMLMRRMGATDVTPHGFRSSFRDWVGDTTSFPPDIAEAALAHTLKSKVERAYRRGDALARRREMMDAWAAFLCGERTDLQASDISEASSP